jgi:hypothetical protein
MLTLGLQVVVAVVVVVVVVVAAVVVTFPLVQAPAAALFSRLHQAGTISAVEWIANDRNFAAYTSGGV